MRRALSGLLLPAAIALAAALASGAVSAADPAPRNPLGGALGGLSVGGFSVGAAVNALQSAGDASREIGEPEEVEMGRTIASGLLGAAPLVDNPRQQDYVNQVGRWLALNSDRPDLPWHFGVIDAATVNAFATPGGNIFVTRGLVERMNSESELAGVLAHEIAHVVQRHHLADIRKNAQKGFVLNLAAVKSGGATGDAARALARVGLEGYARGLSREDELEADRIGVVIAARAGYEPFGLPSVLQTLNALPQGDSAMLLFLKTHPSPADRLAALEAEIPPSYDALAVPNPALDRFERVFPPTR